MSFKHIGNMGGQNYRAEVDLAAVAVVKDTLLYNVSGYASNASPASAPKTHNLIGIVQNSVDNSGGSAGDLSALIEMSPLALYEADCDDVLDATLIWTNVILATAATIDEDNAADTDTGIIKMREMISASKALVSLNFASPADS